LNSNPELTEQQLMVQQLARDFAAKEIAPFGKEWDQKCEYPFDVVRKMGENNFFGLIFPPEYGGIGAGHVAFLLAMEEICRANVMVGTALWQRPAVGDTVYLAGSEYLKKTYLTPLAEGKHVVTIGYTEPDTGLFPQGIKAVARKDGDDYIINGHKRFNSFSSICDWVSFWVRTSPTALGLFVVEREKAGKGWITEHTEDLMGRRGVISSDLILENVRVPKENLIGKEDEGYPILLKMVARTESPGVAAESLGIAQAALDEAIKYATTRIQPWIGKPITAHQGIQFRIADIAIDVAAARSLIYHVGQLIDAGQIPRMEAAQAKAFAVTAAKRAVDNSMHVHGAYGYTKDFTIERLYRDQKLSELYGGSTDIQRMIVAEGTIQGK